VPDNDATDGRKLCSGRNSKFHNYCTLNLQTRPAKGGFHTIAGFMLQQLGHLPKLGEHFDYEGWRFEVVDLDGRRIDKVLAIPPKG